VVSLEVTTAEGQSVPEDLAAIAVAPGTTVATDVTSRTDETPMTVRVFSDGGPVLAGAFVFDAQGRSLVKEFAYAGSVGPLVGPALLSDVVVDRPTGSTLLLTALGGHAAVDVTPVPVAGRSGPRPAARRVQVPAMRTVAVALSTMWSDAVLAGRISVEVRPVPGSAAVYASRYLRERGERGPLTTILQLQGGAQRVVVPAIRRDPMVGVSR
jgi:hypothetical protein